MIWKSTYSERYVYLTNNKGVAWRVCDPKRYDYEWEFSRAIGHEDFIILAPPSLVVWNS